MLIVGRNRPPRQLYPYRDLLHQPLHLISWNKTVLYKAEPTEGEGMGSDDARGELSLVDLVLTVCTNGTSL